MDNSLLINLIKWVCLFITAEAAALFYMWTQGTIWGYLKCSKAENNDA